MLDCKKELTQIPIADLLRMQHGNRLGPDEMERLRLAIVGNGGRLRKPIIANRFEDGRIAIRDGHHRLQVLAALGRTHLSVPDEIRLENLTYAQYREVDFSQGWVTPFDPRTEVRLAQLGGFKKLIQLLRQSLSDEDVRRFILQHPEAYSISRAEADGNRPIEEAAFEGSLRDREAYLKRLDISMPLKIAQVLPTFPSHGVLYEPGMGSGTQAAAYAAYHPHLLVVASDLDLKAVRYAQSQHLLPNIVYVRANAMDPLFPKGFLSSVADSSLGHHITRFGPPAFREANIDDYRRVVFESLAPGERYAMRDFNAPIWPARVVIELPNHAQAGPPPYGDLSLPKLFEHFAAHFESHDFPDGFEWKITATTAEETSIEAPGEIAANFLLHFTYTKKESWEAELKEQYTYYSAVEHRRSLEAVGFRVDYAGEIHNPYIIRNWWDKNGIRIHDVDGKRLDTPPTNFLTYVTKPAPTDLRSMTLEPSPRSKSHWLQSTAWRDSETGQVWDLITVPGITRSYIPYEKTRESLFFYLLPQKEVPGTLIYQRESPPRPGLLWRHAGRHPDPRRLERRRRRREFSTDLTRAIGFSLRYDHRRGDADRIAAPVFSVARWKRRSRSPFRDRHGWPRRRGGI